MKRFCLILFVFMICSLVAHSQTKEKTIEWLKENTKLYGDAALTEVYTCVIVFKFTAFFPIDEFREFSVNPDNGQVFWILKNGETVKDKYGNRVAFMSNVAPIIIEKFTKAIKHLQPFCKEEQADDLF